MISIPSMPIVVEIVRRLDGEHFLCREVADALDVSTATIRRLGARKVLAPTTIVFNGTMAVPVYDMATVERLSAHLAQHRSGAGRPRLWSDAERRVRRAAYNALGYRRRRAAALRKSGDHCAADRVQQEADRLAAQLRADRLQRVVQSRCGPPAICRK